MKKKKIRGIIRTIVVFLLIYIILSSLYVMFVYESVFKAYRSDYYSVFPDYETLAEAYEMNEISFSSKGITLIGRVYSAEAPKAVVIMAHNKDASAQSLIGTAEAFLSNNYSVLLFDLTGHAESSGDSQVGLCRPADDVGSAIEFAAGYETLKNLPVLLYGQGMGGYGACAAMGKYPEVKGVVSVSAYGDSADMLLEYSVKGMSVFGAVEFPITALYNLIVFGGDVFNNAVSGINSSSAPVMIINGKEDKTVNPEGAALIKYRDRITNPGAVYLEIENRGHNNTLYSDNGVEINKAYSDEINALYKSYNNNPPIDDVKVIIEKYKGFDICETDSSVMGSIISFFDSAVL